MSISFALSIISSSGDTTLLTSKSSDPFTFSKLVSKSSPDFLVSFILFIKSLSGSSVPSRFNFNASTASAASPSVGSNILSILWKVMKLGLR